MRILIVDDTVPFDGATARQAPLGASQRALLGLAEALAGRGHRVEVANRCRAAGAHGGVMYTPLAGLSEDAPADLGIAWRSAALLPRLKGVRRRLLWVDRDPAALETPAARLAIGEARAALVVPSPLVARRVAGDAPVHVIAPAVGQIFRACRAEGTAAPVAITFAHPRRGLAAMLALWCTHVHPQLPEAALIVVSGLLSAGLAGQGWPAALDGVMAALKDSLNCGVQVESPGPEGALAAHLAAARLYLQPEDRNDVLGLPVLEAMAAGVPVLAYSGGVAETRIDSGQNGYVVPDAAAYANLAVMMLRGGDMWREMSAAARMAVPAAGAVAAQWEKLGA